MGSAQDQGLCQPALGGGPLYIQIFMLARSIAGAGGSAVPNTLSICTRKSTTGRWLTRLLFGNLSCLPLCRRFPTVSLPLPFIPISIPLASVQCTFIANVYSSPLFMFCLVMALWVPVQRPALPRERWTIVGTWSSWPGLRSALWARYMLRSHPGHGLHSAEIPSSQCPMSLCSAGYCFHRQGCFRSIWLLSVH